MGAGILHTMTAVLLLPLVPAMAFPNDRAGEKTDVTLAVEVIDSQGYPVPGASVRMSRGRKAWSGHADSLGVARFSVSRKGRYDISVTLDGFAAAKRERVALERGVGVTIVRIPLALADVPAQVTTEEPPLSS